jgi:hypothetical protein
MAVEIADPIHGGPMWDRRAGCRVLASQHDEYPPVHFLKISL